MTALNTAALALIIIGGLNWGLVGLFDFNLVAAIFGDGSVLTRIIYIVVGIAAIYGLYLFKPLTAHTEHARVAR